jgi:hypothetical protein
MDFDQWFEFGMIFVYALLRDAMTFIAVVLLLIIGDFHWGWFIPAAVVYLANAFGRTVSLGFIFGGL